MINRSIIFRPQRIKIKPAAVLLMLLLPLWTGCTTLVATRSEPPVSDKLQMTAVQGRDQPENMRELNRAKTPIADLSLPEGNSTFNDNMIADRNGNCPAGTVSYLSTEKGRSIINKTIIASGYGAPPARLLSPIQKRLLALRAAKLDAIRTLAERISGIHIWGGATISDLALKSDRIHVQLDSFIRGARMISMSYLNDGSYEAVMEVNFNQNVLKRLNINRCLPAEQVVKMQYSSL